MSEVPLCLVVQKRRSCFVFQKRYCLPFVRVKPSVGESSWYSDNDRSLGSERGFAHVLTTPSSPQAASWAHHHAVACVASSNRILRTQSRPQIV